MSDVPGSEDTKARLDRQYTRVPLVTKSGEVLPAWYVDRCVLLFTAEEGWFVYETTTGVVVESKIAEQGQRIADLWAGCESPTSAILTALAENPQ